jgi:parvulin-like peptidyl-prolyl isomerase
MTINVKISDQDILEQVKLSFKIPEITEQILTRRIIEDVAKEANVKIEIGELQKAADIFRAENRLSSAKNTQLWLDIHKISLDDFENFIRLNLIIEKIKSTALIGSVEEYFYQNQSDFDQVTMHEIILESKELATELYYSVREKEIRFQDITSNTSIKGKSRYVEKLSRKLLHKDLRSIFSTSNTPQILRPITTANGYHLIWIESIIKAELDKSIYKDIEDQLFQGFIMSRIIEIGDSLLTSENRISKNL